MRKLVSESLSGIVDDARPCASSGDAAFPQEQRVEELARAAASAAAARRDRFLAEVALADDLALRGRRRHFDRPLAEHALRGCSTTRCP